MKAGNYPLRPSGYQRRMLAVLAAGKIGAFSTPSPDYDGFLMEDIRSRMPNGKRDRAALSSAMRGLLEAGYVVNGRRAEAVGAAGQPGYFHTYQITPKGLRVALGVLG